MAQAIHLEFVFHIAGAFAEHGVEQETNCDCGKNPAHQFRHISLAQKNVPFVERCNRGSLDDAEGCTSENQLCTQRRNKGRHAQVSNNGTLDQAHH